MRSWKVGTLAGALSCTLFAACSNDDTASGDTVSASTSAETAPATTTGPGSGGSVESTEASDDTVSAGGVLRVVQASEPPSLNPLLFPVKNAMWIAATIVEPIIDLEAVDSFEPIRDGLITSWERTGELSWQFKVRTGVEFQNGEPWDAEAAAFSIMTNTKQSGGAVVAFYQSVIGDAVALDAETVEITTLIPSAEVPALLSAMFALPPQHYEEVGGEAFGMAPVGTGPYVFVEWAPGERIVTERNDDYWGGVPAIDGMEWSWAPDDQSRINLLVSGDVDLTIGVPPAFYDQVTSSANAELDSLRSLRKLMLGINISDPVMSDLRVREALARAIDRDAIVEGIFDGNFYADPNLLPSVFPSAGGHGDEYLTYDPDRAREILAEVGDLPPIDFHYPVGRYINDGAVAEAVAGMLEAVGFTVNRDPLDSATFFQELFTGDMSGFWMPGLAPLYPHEDIIVRVALTTDATIPYCGDETFDQMANAGLDLTGAEREAHYREIERRAIIEKICFVPLYDEQNSWGRSSNVSGFVPRIDEYMDFRRVSIEAP